MSASNSKTTRNGTGRDDVIVGTAGRDTINGKRGNDVIDGAAGNDKLNGGKGNDIVLGGAGNDRIQGGKGNDWLDGGSGNDSLDGGKGDDLLDGGAGNDVVDGGDGNDRAVYTLAENAGSRDRYDGGKGFDTLQINLTAAEYAARRAELDALADWIGDHANPNRDGPGLTTSFGLNLRNFEALDIRVIGPANHAPDAIADTANVGEDAVVAIAVLANDRDPDGGDVLSVSAIATAATLGLVSINTHGTVTYATNGAFNYLAAGETATDSFTYTGSDGHGGFDTATVTVSVTGVNDAPVAGDDAATVGEDAAVRIAVLANDTDADRSDTHVIAAVDTARTLGHVSINTDGTVTYATNGAFNYLAAGETATDSFTYTGSDGHGGFDTALVTVSVTGVNDAPVAADDRAGTDEDTTLTLSAASLLANDEDADTSDTLAVVGVGAAVNGTVAFVGDEIVFTPTANFSGIASFTYIVDDGQGGFDTATVTVDVAAVADAPIIAASAAGGIEGTTVALAITAMLADTDGSEALGDLVIDGLPIGALLSAGTDNGGGSWTLTPAQLNGLTVTLPSVDADAIHAITVTGAATEQANGDSEAATASFDLAITNFLGNVPPVATANIVITNILNSDDFPPVVTLAEIEANDTMASAQALSRRDFGIGLDAEAPDSTLPRLVVDGTIAADGDVDFYSLVLNAGERLIVDLDRGWEWGPFALSAYDAGDGTGQDEQIDFDLWLYDANGTLLRHGQEYYVTPDAGSEDFSDGYLDFTVSSTGTYYFAVNAPTYMFPGADNPGDYRLHVGTVQTVLIPGQALTHNDSDGAGDAIAIDAVSLGTNGVAVLAGGDVGFALIDQGVDGIFTYTATDGALVSNAATVTVTNVASQTLTGAAADEILAGNDFGNTIDGGAGDDVLIGGRGADDLIGGSGDDLFIFNPFSGIDRIRDFAAGDAIDLTAWDFSSIDDLFIGQDGADAVIHLDGTMAGPDKIMLLGVSATSLDADDFIFA
ncbi:MAG: tandem-95 repeat protein [Rhodospirillaceae bacterium]|nr:tandem-95 repeat protein [Rhodospirillaceae bacterium]